MKINYFSERNVTPSQVRRFAAFLKVTKHFKWYRNRFTEIPSERTDSVM